MKNGAPNWMKDCKGCTQTTNNVKWSENVNVILKSNLTFTIQHFTRFVFCVSKKSSKHKFHVLTTSKKKSTCGRLCTKKRTGCRSIVTLTVKSCGVPGLTVFLGIASWCECISVSSKSNTNVLRWTILRRCRDTGDNGNKSYFTGWYWTNWMHYYFKYNFRIGFLLRRSGEKYKINFRKRLRTIDKWRYLQPELVD